MFFQNFIKHKAFCFVQMDSYKEERMGLRIATNIPAVSAQKNLYGLSIAQATAMERLASGYRINKSADDAAGLAMSESIKALTRGYAQADRNANDGISLIQIAEGSLNEITNMLVRLRELAMQAASDTIGDRERALVDIEYQNLKEEINRVAVTTKYNDTPLLDGQGGVLDFQIGVGNDQTQDRISFDAGLADVTLQAMQMQEVNVLDKMSAQQSLSSVDDAISYVTGMRANFGALQNRLQSTSQNLKVQEENFTAANSRIRDADIAVESSNLAKNNVLLQAATAVLAQANQNNNLALKLISNG